LKKEKQIDLKKDESKTEQKQEKLKEKQIDLKHETNSKEENIQTDNIKKLSTHKKSKDILLVKTPEQIEKIPIKKLEKLIYSSGYYKNKARTLKHVSSVILEKYKGKVPNIKSELLSIKGIGPKTANVVLNFAYNQLVIPVDANVHRISNRLGWVKTKTAEKTEPALEKILPKKYWREINALFVLHGKTICQPISPRCSKCPINKFCQKMGVKRKR
jgi:endonuclease-3